MLCRTGQKVYTQYTHKHYRKATDKKDQKNYLYSFYESEGEIFSFPFSFLVDPQKKGKQHELSTQKGIERFFFAIFLFFPQNKS